MNARQQQIFERHTGHSSFETHIQDYRDKGITWIDINDNEYQLWESGFASYCMESYEYVVTKDGIKVQIP